MSTVTDTRTTTFTVQPFATVSPLSEAALDAVMTALVDDERAIAPVVGYDPDTDRIDAIFQIEISDADPHPGDTPRTLAYDRTCIVFDRALELAGVAARTSQISVVEGDDPDQLP